MAATDDVDLPDDFDVIQSMDLDLSSVDGQFRGAACYYRAIFSDADIVSHCRYHGGGALAAGPGLGDDDDCSGDRAEEQEAGSSPAGSGVTDGPLAPVARDAAAAEAMSAYVAELERFLLEEDDDDDAQAEVDPGLLGVVDVYFAGGVAAWTDGDKENGDEEEKERSASRKHAR